MSGTVQGRGTPRRTVVAAVGAVGFTAALTACGSDSSGDESQTEETPGAGETTAEASESPTEEEQPEEPESGGGLAKTSDIPEGGGKIFKDEKVVVTQPAAGEFKAFTAVCTHQGCIVSSVSDGTINCACHGSKFSITDGAVENGPATQPLAAANVTVEGEELKLA